MFVPLLKKIGVMLSLGDPGWGRSSQDEKNQQQTGNGKKPNDAPPDLDQLWRDFNQRWGRFLGGKNGSNNNNSGTNGNQNSGMKEAGLGVGAIAVVVLFLWLASGFFIIQEGQTGVVMTFGKYSYDAPAGFNWRWPYPIQDHEVVNFSQVRTAEIGYRSSVKNKQAKESLMLTDDENIIDIQFAVQYKLSSASEWIFNNRDQDETIRQVAETSIREIVGKSKMDFVLYEGREKVALDVAQLMQQILNRYKSGVQIVNVTMQGVQPPEQVQVAFDDAVKAGQDKERQKNEGQAYANDVIPKARGAASRLMQESEGYRASVIANAQGDAARFKQVLTEYQKAPAVMRDRMYLETMQQIFTSTTKVMVDAKNGSNMIYLPLDKLISQSAASTSSVQSAPSTVNDGANGVGNPNMKSNILMQPNTAAANSLQDALQAVDVPRSKDIRSRDSRDREAR